MIIGRRIDWMMVEEAGAHVGDSSTINGGAETMVGWGRDCGMMVKGSGAQTCGDSLA